MGNGLNEPGENFSWDGCGREGNHGILVLTFITKYGLTWGMKGKPSKVAKRRLHETPKEFAEAEKGKQSYEYQRWQRICEERAEWYRNNEPLAHPKKRTYEQRMALMR